MERKIRGWSLVVAIVCFIIVAGLVIWVLKFSTEQPPLKDSSEFREVIQELNTPEKLQSYIEENFKFDKSHEASPACSPEEFFYEKEGDVRDFSVFSSYVLDQHGYQAKIVWFIYIDETGRKGADIVTLFQDKDGGLKYMRLLMFDEGVIKMGIFQIESLEDLLAQEEKRINCQIIEYGLLPAGSTSFDFLRFKLL